MATGRQRHGRNVRGHQAGYSGKTRKEFDPKSVQMGIADPGFGRAAPAGRAVAGQIGKALTEFKKKTGALPARPAPSARTRSGRPQTKSAPQKAPAAPKKTTTRTPKYDEKRGLWL
jgi:hypothetical protein